MKNINEQAKDGIRAKLSALAGSDVGPVHTELFLSPEFGAYRAHVLVLYGEKGYSLKIEDLLTSKLEEVDIRWAVIHVAFCNREHRKILSTFSAS